jgi:hypothetical protein
MTLTSHGYETTEGSRWDPKDVDEVYAEKQFSPGFYTQATTRVIDTSPGHR